MTLNPLCDVEGCHCPAVISITVYPLSKTTAICHFHERALLSWMIANIDRLSADTGIVHLPIGELVTYEHPAVPRG